MKPIWLLPAFVAGGIATALVMRSMLPHPPENFDVFQHTTVSPISPPKPTRIVAAADAPAKPVAQTPSAAQSAARAAGDSSATRDARVVTSSAGSTIDLGPMLRETISTHFVPQVSPLELHTALEKEPRDDSWSYPIEAEIRSSLASITANDVVKVETLECRSTLCEIRLSTQYDSAHLMNEWNRDVGMYPWARRAAPISNFMTSGNGKAESLLILRREPAAEK